MSGSVGWLPAKSKVQSSLYKWRIQDFSKQEFGSEIYDPFEGTGTYINGLQSSVISFWFICDEKYQRVSCCLWLTRDPIEINGSNDEPASQSLRLSLLTDESLLLDNRVPENDSRNMCCLDLEWREAVHREADRRFLAQYRQQPHRSAHVFYESGVCTVRRSV